MITITIFQNQNQYEGFCCVGHAGYAESGSDIICAGVSMLVINTINSIEKFSSSVFEIETNEETGLIDFTFKSEVDHDAKLLIDSMILGLQGIQSDYGTEYLSLDFKEV